VANLFLIFAFLFVSCASQASFITTSSESKSNFSKLIFQHRTGSNTFIASISKEGLLSVSCGNKQRSIMHFEQQDLSWDDVKLIDTFLKKHEQKFERLLHFRSNTFLALVFDEFSDNVKQLRPQSPEKLEALKEFSYFLRSKIKECSDFNF